MVEISQLDALNLHGIYDVAGDGVILSINSSVRSQDIKPPKCPCGASLQGTRRYRLHSKLVDFKHTCDLLLSKTGHKLAAFATAIEVQGKQLDQTFEACIAEIRPNPLAAKANATLLLRRNQEILDLQKYIINFRTEVVDRFQGSIAVLHRALPNVIPSYNLSFHLHLDVLEYRVVLARLADALKLSNQLLSLKDPSFGVQRLGLKMIQFVCKESVSCTKYCQSALDTTLIGTNPSIEAEIRLQQLQFMLFAKSTRARLSELGHPVEDAIVIVSEETVKTSLDAVSEIGRRSPGTCGSLMETARKIAVAFGLHDGWKASPILKIKNDYARQIENLWGRHELGFLTICTRLHPYSAKTFSDGCPNCEKQAQLSADEIFRESGKHLFEKKFLQMMHARSTQSAESESSERESPKSAERSTKQPVSDDKAVSSPGMEMTQEAKFLAAIRKKLPKIHAGGPCATLKIQSEQTVDEELASEVDIEAAREIKLGVMLDRQSISVEPEKELTMEEKFLVAMRKIGKH
ncbi:uncharacterized protein A1O5_02609 [Cladophialophora psammophila CBS 110553]|uniref:Uncharacterized protein n=1 Tax=Cladophialophora psammophila CBS 110553 TaxID=1182543 RepID=W9X2A3_9EURO|nr:uncharacterized protein A1O5_02609 [Cladophialophora psammophila CBS 110553]EXJ74313.1 hypothetical protein A1O5_02609 [Cladophialophora psammophila CBS 110553]